jgi:cobalt-zinc-cadmium efflux system outer membrane protein
MRLTWLVGLAALAVAPRAGAQSVTEEEFLSAFTAESAAVRALSEGVARAEGARRQAGVLSNPRVDFWREQPDANPRVTNWTLAWTPPLDGRYGLGKQVADAGLAAARERLAGDKAALRREIRAAFAAWSLAFERHVAARRLLDRVHALAEAERQRARVGEESGLSARRFTLAEAEVKAGLATIEASLATAEAVARAWRPDLAPEATPAPLVPPDPPAQADPEASPELRALAFEAEQATLDRKRAGRFVAFPTLQFGWQQVDDAGVGRSGPIFAAGWTVPLFDREQGARAEAEGRRLAAAARLEVARAQLAARVSGGVAAYRALVAASRDAARVEGDVDRVMTGATAAYRAGEGSLTDLFDSLRAAVGARLGEIDLRAQAMESHRELEAALGRPLVGGGF